MMTDERPFGGVERVCVRVCVCRPRGVATLWIASLRRACARATCCVSTQEQGARREVKEGKACVCALDRTKAGGKIRTHLHLFIHSFIKVHSGSCPIVSFVYLYFVPSKMDDHDDDSMQKQKAEQKRKTPYNEKKKKKHARKTRKRKTAY